MAMRRAGLDGGFWLCLGLNLIFTVQWSIPAWIALVLHFVLRISLIWFAGLLVLWILIVFLTTLLLSKIASMPGSGTGVRTPEEQAEKDRQIREISRSVGEKQRRQRSGD